MGRKRENFITRYIIFARSIVYYFIKGHINLIFIFNKRPGNIDHKYLLIEKNKHNQRQAYGKKN